MQAALKARWVEALRSGEFKQGQAHLLNDGKYCCLGVLCVVAGVDEGALKGRAVLDGGELGQLKLLSDNPSDALVRGTRTYNEIDSLETALINMNDNEGYSFDEIADWIEENIGTTEPA